MILRGSNYQKFNHLLIWGLIAGIILSVCLTAAVHAQSSDSGFSLQVTPSPLIGSIQPATPSTLELKIRNTGTKSENLRIDLRKFTTNEQSGEIQLTEELPTDVSQWVSFSAPTFTIAAGEWFTETINLNPPQDIGFTYSFATVISRASEPNTETGTTKLKGSVAVFTLLTADRPGMERKFDVISFSSIKRLYEYLPATFKVRLKNTGNTLVQPYGNIFIQRSGTSKEPLAVLKLNSAGGYILPGVTREFEVSWDDGFPSYVKRTSADNTTAEEHLQWDWSKVQNLRFGRYVAKLVAVYNDGQRDIPIEAEVSFWVIPWKILLLTVLVLLVLVVGIITIIRKTTKLVKKRNGPKNTDTQEN